MGGSPQLAAAHRSLKLYCSIVQHCNAVTTTVLAAQTSNVHTPLPSFLPLLRCALDKECYCKEDIHCPELHRCEASKAPGLQQYKICKPDWRLHPESGRA